MQKRSSAVGHLACHPHLHPSFRKTWKLANLTVLFLTLASMMVEIGSAQEVIDPRQPSEADIRSWITDLGSENYSARETANRHISRWIDQALPLLTEAAESATDAGTEPVLRFIGFIASDTLSERGVKAFECLERIANDRMTNRAIIAQRILEDLSLQLRESSLQKLRSLGVSCDTRYLSVLTRTVEVRKALIINDEFQGTEQDLDLLKWLFDVEFVKLEGPRITGEILRRVALLPKLNSLQIIDTPLSGRDLACLQEAPDLKLLEILYTPIDDSSIEILEQLPVYGDMQLFGTEISAAGSKDLIARVDSANIFVGRGGFLGIQCEPSSLIIREAVKDGPAFRSGIRTLDKLLKIDGVAITNFEELRKELAKSADGETVIVEFERPVLAFGRDRDEQQGRRQGGLRMDAYAPMKVEVVLGRRPSEMNR